MLICPRRFRTAFPASFCLCLLAAVAGCGGGGGSSTPPNQPPTVAAIDDQTARPGELVTVRVAIADADAGDTHTVAVRSGDAEIATVAVNGATLTITAVARGTATITVTATDNKGATSAAVTFAVTVEAGWVAGVFEDASLFKNFCTVPRSGSSDQQGDVLDENNWLRSWSNDTYLWYDEIEDVDPACCDTLNYFDLLRTTATTPSGAPKDKYHFTYDTEEWIALSQSGVSGGFGAEFSLLRTYPPRDIRVAYTEPDTPATRVDLRRGAKILEIDGVDAVHGSEVATLNEGIFGPQLGKTYEFTIQDPGTDAVRTVAMTAEKITEDPVQHVTVLETDAGPVGYMLSNSHIATAEAQLIDAVQELAAAGIADLVLDLRYNGGGRLSIANRMAAMIAGSSSSGKVFEELQHNDKQSDSNQIYPFASTSSDGEALPGLDLQRLFVLSGADTCSASESIINGLRGIDVEVVLVGTTTCGKPYGFYPEDNCGTAYFTIQFKGVNAAGFGDFPDGFSPANLPRTEGIEVPGCLVADDFEHSLGDPAEGRLQAALQYRIDGSCPEPSGFAGREMTASKGPGGVAAGLSVGADPLRGLKVVER